MKRALAAAALLALVAPAYAEPSVAARVSSNEATLSQSITLVVEVSGAAQIAAPPDFSIPDFQVERAGQTRSFQWINGQSSSLVGYNYILTPTKTGTLQIPAISMTVDGKTYTTQPILVVVHPDGGTSAPAAGAGGAGENRAVDVPAEGLRPLFMTATVDTDRAYVGQQIVLKVQFLRRPDIQLASQARYSEPDLTGFLVEPMKQQKYATTINGAQYEVDELPYALFPTSDGEFAIGGAQIEVAVRAQSDPFDPNSFFQNFFGRSQVARLTTRSMPIHVRALPRNKPANFSGAVGRFKMTAKTDATTAEVGKPINLTLTVTGVGNIKALKEPFLPEPRGFRRYETISTSQVSNDGKFLHGSKDFKILLMPQASGNLVIPSAQFPYFDPASNEYVVATTPEIPITVKPGNLAAAGDVTAGGPAPAGAPQAGTAEGIRVLERDIRFIKTGRVTPITAPIYLRGWFILFNLIPPLFAVTAFAVRKGRERRMERPEEYRARTSGRRARKRLALARRAMSEPSAATFYGEIQAAITGFIADRLGAAAAGLTRDEIEATLLRWKADEETSRTIRDLLDRADMARFASASFTDDDRGSALAAAAAAITRLEKLG
ncbi:MAG: protein BatD [Elusimicrobia bacterium]|nr:protein BatD [Elusimicrobiota bacterium]